MDRLTFKAAVAIATDQGLFEAVISTETIDREKDIVQASAMVAALSKWNRPIPLAWNHSAAAEDIFGSLDPASVKEVNGEVVAQGQVDLESTVGKEAWRSFKNRTIGFSFGYIIADGGSTRRKGGGRTITALDVFEVTATPTPMNNDTRVLSTKAAMAPGQMADKMRAMAGEMASENPPEPAAMARRMREMADQMAAMDAGKSADGLRQEAKRVGREVEQSQLPDDVPPAADQPPGPDPVAQELQEVKARLAQAEQAVEDLKTKADETDKGTRSRSVDPLRKQAEAMALEIASGGQSLLKPPKTVAPPPADLIPLDELKKRMRDEMLGVLSGDDIT